MGEDVGCVSLFQLSRAALPGEIESMAVSPAQSVRKQQQQHQQLLVVHQQQSPMVDDLCLEVKAWWLSHLVDMVSYLASSSPPPHYNHLCSNSCSLLC